MRQAGGPEILDVTDGLLPVVAQEEAEHERPAIGLHRRQPALQRAPQLVGQPGNR